MLLTPRMIAIGGPELCSADGIILHLPTGSCDADLKDFMKG